MHAWVVFTVELAREYLLSVAYAKPEMHPVGDSSVFSAAVLVDKLVELDTRIDNRHAHLFGRAELRTFDVCGQPEHVRRVISATYRTIDHLRAESAADVDRMAEHLSHFLQRLCRAQNTHYLNIARDIGQGGAGGGEL